ncbi:unnamed protein product, partial [Prorocentrum cordatum]
ISHEIYLKRIKAALQETIEARLFADKEANAITVKWRQLLKLSIASPGATPTVSWNMVAVRAIGQTQEALQAVVDRVLEPEDLAWAHQCPATRSTFIVGDFNFGDYDETDNFLDDDQPQQAQVAQPSSGGGGRAHAAPASGQTARLARRPGQRQWLEALREATEMMPGKPTHWNASTRTSSSIDRVFVGVPRWQLCQGWQTCQVRGEAREMHIRGISDHSLVAASLMRRTPGHRRPDTPAAIPLAVIQRPRFKEIVDGYLAMVPLQSQEPPDEYKYFTRILQAAAKDVQNEILVAEGWTKGASAIIWRQLARAFWRQDWKLAQLVVAQNAWARELVK